MKKILILQSNYIPWKGYFDLIAAVDEFIIYDDMQFTKNDWRNRNKIKTPQGSEWISIPVGSDISRKIREVLLPENGWQVKHLKSLEINYGRAPYFDEVMNLLKPVYFNQNIKSLSEFNRALIELVCQYLGIKTKISYCWDYTLVEGKTERLVSLSQQANAQVCLFGPAAKDYLDESLFKEKMIKIEWFDYSGYPEYPQLWGDFEHAVSVLDLLFNCGKNADSFLKIARKI
jgi:WbqC-like protein family